MTEVERNTVGEKEAFCLIYFGPIRTEVYGDTKAGDESRRGDRTIRGLAFSCWVLVHSTSACDTEIAWTPEAELNKSMPCGSDSLGKRFFVGFPRFSLVL